MNNFGFQLFDINEYEKIEVSNLFLYPKKLILKVSFIEKNESLPN